MGEMLDSLSGSFFKSEKEADTAQANYKVKKLTYNDFITWFL